MHILRLMSANELLCKEIVTALVIKNSVALSIVVNILEQNPNDISENELAE